MTTRRYIIYCDESDDKGRFYSNFYGGALLSANDRPQIEAELEEAKGDSQASEFKWTEIGPGNEHRYIRFVECLFKFIYAGKIKFRIMFTQNINQTKGVIEYEHDDEQFFILYYHFLKWAFGLQYCHPGSDDSICISVYLDDVPDSLEKFNNFKDYLSSLSNFPVFFDNRIVFPKSEIVDVDSQRHVILQGVDVILGAIQFRLNNKHLVKQPGKRGWRGKRTRAKHRVYKRVNQLIQKTRRNFNIGVSTGDDEGPHNRWSDAYRHWCFVPTGSVKDLSRGKKAMEKG